MDDTHRAWSGREGALCLKAALEHLLPNKLQAIVDSGMTVGQLPLLCDQSLFTPLLFNETSGKVQELTRLLQHAYSDKSNSTALEVYRAAARWSRLDAKG